MMTEEGGVIISELIILRDVGLNPVENCKGWLSIRARKSDIITGGKGRVGRHRYKWVRDKLVEVQGNFIFYFLCETRILA